MTFEMEDEQTMNVHSLGSQTIRVVVVDDHPVVVDGMKSMIDLEPDLELAGRASTMAEARQLLSKDPPDVCVVDITLPDGSGIELTKELVQQYPDMRVLVLSMHDEDVYAERSLRAGARGYVRKVTASNSIVRAIREVYRGSVYLESNTASQILSHMVGGRGEGARDPLQNLSDRELEIFRLLGEGYTNPQIAEKCYVSIKTVESYFRRIREKLDLSNTAELRQYAIRWRQSEPNA